MPVRPLIITFGLLLASVISTHAVAGISTQCPEQIDSNDCVANDLQPTGTTIINGPTACTEGETFAATVRVLFEDGGGANERYTVGFFVGENGESAIGGTSCTFDSLQPVGDPIDLTGGSGGFLELSGDSCGDISRSDPTYKDIELDNILCKDEDGDGNVDVSYVLTWENNANQTSCTDPLDPTQFDPRPPKCLSDLEYDLPIEVEQPPSIEVTKFAAPSTIREPGDQVAYGFTIINTSPSVSDPVEIVSIVDEPYGDVSDLTTCDLPFVLAVGESTTCTFITDVTGTRGDVIVDVVTVTGMDDEGEEVSDIATARVTVLEPDAPEQPGDLRLFKFAVPGSVPEPGGMVRYEVVAANLSPTPVTLETLVDDLYGDLNGKGNCSVPQQLQGLSFFYACGFTEEVTGQPGDIIPDVIVATGTDGLPERTELFAEARAEVEIYNLESAIDIVKWPTPETVTEPGALVDFALRIQNTSAVDDVAINILLDSQLGVPQGTCRLPTALRPGEIYECVYPGFVGGNAGDTVTNVVLAEGRDDDNQIVTDFTAASTFVVGADPSIEVVKLAVPPVALETGSPVRYVVGIQNTSASTDPVTITGMEDDIYGPLDGLGNCDLTPGDQPLVLAPAPDPGSFYLCSWLVDPVTGTQGVPLIDTVTVTGVDDEDTPVIGMDSATVNFVAVDPGTTRLDVVKIAAPVEVPEPGGDVTYTIVLSNSSDPGDINLDMTVTSLVDVPYGDLNGRGDCATPIDLPVGAVYSCSFNETVSGAVGDQVTDTVTATATYQTDQVIMGSDTATVTITDIPASILVQKTADLPQIVEPGGDITFEVLVANTSQVDDVEITSLVDNLHGDLNGQGSCTMPQTLPQGGEPYGCQFTVLVEGPGGYQEVNTITASGTDDDGQPVSGTAQATVSIIDLPPSLEATKTADPNELGPNGGDVTFTFNITNTSEADDIDLESLVDSQFGDLNGQGDCSVPQTLVPGQSYVCSFTTTLDPNPGGTHFDRVKAQGTSDDDDPVSASASAIVTFMNLARIPAVGGTGLAILVLLLGWLGVAAMRKRRMG